MDQLIARESRTLIIWAGFCIVDMVESILGMKAANNTQCRTIAGGGQRARVRLSEAYSHKYAYIYPVLQCVNMLTFWPAVFFKTQSAPCLPILSLSRTSSTSICSAP